jgi:hypothetical protein
LTMKEQIPVKFKIPIVPKRDLKLKMLK